MDTSNTRRAAVQRLQRQAPALRQQTDDAATRLRQLAAGYRGAMSTWVPHRCKRCRTEFYAWAAAKRVYCSDACAKPSRNPRWPQQEIGLGVQRCPLPRVSDSSREYTPPPYALV